MRRNQAKGEWIDLSKQHVKGGYQLLMDDPIIPADLLGEHDGNQAEMFIRQILEEQGFKNVQIYREDLDND